MWTAPEFPTWMQLALGAAWVMLMLTASCWFFVELSNALKEARRHHPDTCPICNWNRR